MLPFLLPIPAFLYPCRTSIRTFFLSYSFPSLPYPSFVSLQENHQPCCVTVSQKFSSVKLAHPSSNQTLNVDFIYIQILVLSRTSHTHTEPCIHHRPYSFGRIWVWNVDKGEFCFVSVSLRGIYERLSFQLPNWFSYPHHIASTWRTKLWSMKRCAHNM
jgi:hypothetical protein